MTFSFKILSGIYLGNCKVQKVGTLYGHVIGTCRHAWLWCDFGVMFDIDFAKMFSPAMLDILLIFYHKDM